VADANRSTSNFTFTFFFSLEKLLLLDSADPFTLALILKKDEVQHLQAFVNYVADPLGIFVIVVLRVPDGRRVCS
jgi:hypothetical protein